VGSLNEERIKADERAVKAKKNPEMGNSGFKTFVLYRNN
jgi:hypothetical protein